MRQIALLDAPAALGWRRWREVEERYGLGLIKGSLHLARPNSPAADLDYLAHALLATLVELGLLIAHAEDPEAAAQKAEEAYGRVLSAMLEED